MCGCSTTRRGPVGRRPGGPTALPRRAAGRRARPGDPAVARRMGVAYEWVHRVRPAHAAGPGAEVLEALAAGRVPGALRADQRPALVAADAVFDLSSIPPEQQGTLAAAHGTAAVVELAALVGLYRLIGGMVAAFDIAIESDFAPFLPAW